MGKRPSSFRWLKPSTWLASRKRRNARPPAEAPPSPNKRLRKAAADGDIGGIRAALAEGANPEREKTGWWPHLAAIEADQAVAASYLIDLAQEKGARIDLEVALSKAVCRLASDSAEMLIERGADLKQADRGAMFLWLAASSGDVPMTRLLLERGVPEDNAPAAIASAASNGDKPMLRLLLHEAALEASEYDNQCLKGVLATQGPGMLANLLAQAGAFDNLRDPRDLLEN